MYNYITSSGIAAIHGANDKILLTAMALKSVLKASVFHQSVAKYPSSGIW